MIRTTIRRVILVSTFALTALVAVGGSAGAQPGPDDDPDYSDPMWIYANPADEVTRQSIEESVKFDEDNPAPHWDAGELRVDEQVVAGR